MKSLKARLLLWVCGSVAGVMVAAALVLFALARSYQINQLDRRLRERARLIISMIQLEGDSIELEFEELDLRDFETREAGWYLDVSTVEDGSIFRSPSFGDEDPDFQSAQQSPPVRWVDLPGSSRGRGVALLFDLEDELEGAHPDSFDELLSPGTWEAEPFVVVVFIARDASEVTTALRYLAIGLTAVTGFAILVVALILVGVVNHSMRPVEELAVRIKQIDASDLDASVQLTNLPRELEPIVVQFNALLLRLQSAFQRERGFCADVAHELRTPLAGLRTTLEVTQARPRNREEYVTAIDQCRLVVMQTQNLVDSLLQIAKLETGQIVPRPESIDLKAEMQKLWQDVADKCSPQKNYQLRWNLAADVQAWTDQAVLEIVLRNLFENAIDYVDEQGVIEIESGLTSDEIRMSIANSGSRVAMEDVGKVFDRFWRGSESRSGTGSHFGLGLSLAQRASANLGGTLSVESELNGMFCATFLLPNRGETQAV